MPVWNRTTRLLATLFFGGAVVMAGCGGADGAPGTAGRNGADGADGANGANGANGADGTTGTNGADGTNGTNGVDGVNGQDGKDYVSTKLFKNIDLKVVSVKNSGGALAVTFTAFDNGNPITNLTMAPIRIMFNQYLPKAMAEDNAIWSQDRFYERGGPPPSGTLDADKRLMQDPAALGTYTYTFLETIQEGITNDKVDVAFVTQLAMRITGFETYNRVNAIYQMTGIPKADGDVATEVPAPVGQIVTTESCESCHGPRIGNVGHGGDYTKVEYCRNCHTQDDPAMVTDGVDFRTMIHQIHKAIDHTNGGVDPGFDWSAVTFPQDVRNCDKCHKGVDGANWNLLPTKEACGGCHTAADFVTGNGHAGGAQADNKNCKLCHAVASVKTKHITPISTPNNPATPTGAANFEYKINTVTVNAVSGVPTVNFQILKDGVAMTTLHTVFPPTGFTSNVAFLVAYTLPQDGILNPADWNNAGKVQGQPMNIGLSTVSASMALQADNTYNVALAAAPFPAGAQMRAVGLNGYFTQTNLAALARHTNSVFKEIDSPRRSVVDTNGCLECHEVIELHGGSRTITDKADPTQAPICVMCHNPNLSSSGNTFNIAAYVAGSSPDSDLTITKYGNNPLLWPEDSQNFKELVHGIHSAGFREDPYQHVRIRSGVAYSFDWSTVTFPGDASNCATCHKGNSYMLESIPAEALWSTKITTNGAIVDMASAVASRATVPNATDMVMAPNVGACNGCHDGKLVNAHMDQNGGNFGMVRSDMMKVSAATCSICHDAGSLADVQMMHPGLNP